MLDWLRSIASDPIYGNLILSPVMGVFFSWLLMPSASNRPTNSSRKTIEINYETANQIIHDNRQFHTHYHGSESQQNGEEFALFGLSALFCFSIIYLYITYGSIAISFMQGCAIFSIAATVATIVRGYLFRIYSGTEWAFRLTLPILNAGIILYYIPVENNNLNNIISYVGSQKILDLFFHDPNMFRWILTQTLGIFFGIAALIAGLLVLGHHAAVGAFSFKRNRWRYKFSKATAFFGSWFVVPVLGVVLFGYWYALSGQLYALISPR